MLGSAQAVWVNRRPDQIGLVDIQKDARKLVAPLGQAGSIDSIGDDLPFFTEELQASVREQE